MENQKRNNHIIYGIIGLLISLVLILQFYNIVNSFIEISENFLSKDGYVGSRSIIIINVFVIIGISITLLLSCFLIFNLTEKIYKSIITFLQIYDPVTSNICNKKHLDLYLMVISTFWGVLQFYSLIKYGESISEFAAPMTLDEGKLEIFYNLLLIVAGIIILLSITQIKQKLYSSELKKKILLTIVGICGLLILIIGEELSWGQQFYRWESTGIFSEYNYQSETNIHNFFGPILIKYVYPLVGISFFLILSIIWMWHIKKRRSSYLFNLLFPHPSMFFLAMMMMFSSFLGGGGETFEQLFTIFILIYSIRLFLCLSFPNRKLILKEYML